MTASDEKRGVGVARKRNIKRFVEADDTKESVGLLIRLRLPWLVAGLLGGFLATFLLSRFEQQLSDNVQLAFFIPMIVYLSDAVGSQTETIFIRNGFKKRGIFRIYFAKEFVIGVLLGLIFGVVVGGVAYAWLRDAEIALTVGLATAITTAVAPLVALVIVKLFQIERHDPAVGAGPFATIAQDIITIELYFLVASLILFR